MAINRSWLHPTGMGVCLSLGSHVNVTYALKQTLAFEVFSSYDVYQNDCKANPRASLVQWNHLYGNTNNKKKMQ